MHRQRWMLAGVLAVAACDFIGTDPSGSQGELGNGVFSYSCVNGSDAACDGLMAGAKPLDAPIAVGSRFSVSFQADEGGSARVEAASQSHIDEVSARLDTFEALQEGATALLAMRADRAVDLLHVQVARIDQLRIEELSAQSGSTLALDRLTMVVGQTTTLVASARGAGGEVLVGALEYVWSAPDAAVVDATADPTDNEITIEALAPGSTTFNVTVGDISKEITVDVSSEGAGGAGGSGGSGGAGGSGGGVGGGS